MTRGWSKHRAFPVTKLKSEACLGLGQGFHPNGCVAVTAGLLALLFDVIAARISYYNSPIFQSPETEQ